MALASRTRDRRDKLSHPRRGFWIRWPSPAVLGLPRVPIKGYMSPTTSAPQFETHHTPEPRARCGFWAHSYLIPEQISRSAHQRTGSSLCGRACPTGGALVGRPRQARIFRIASGALIAARSHGVDGLDDHRGKITTKPHFTAEVLTDTRQQAPASVFRGIQARAFFDRDHFEHLHSCRRGRAQEGNCRPGTLIVPKCSQVR